MNSKIVIYCAGLLQGICLVALPAASTIITNSSGFAFTSTDYGSLFIPQSLLAILASAINPYLSRKLGLNRVLSLGIIANLLSMLLLTLSTVWMHNFHGAYGMLLTAAGFLGLGFGLVVPTINEMLALLYPAKVNSKLLILNALLGVGTTLAPILILLFTALGFWWGLPLTLVCLLSLLFILSLNMPTINNPDISLKKVRIPSRFWFFAVFALLYGVIETLNGNWVQIYMKTVLHADLRAQSLALTAFWGMVTLGRVFFALIDKVIKEETAFKMAPFIACGAFFLIASLPVGTSHLAVLSFGLMGFGCSVLLPLTISFGTKDLKSITSSVPGLIIACYLLGYGIAAFGAGPLIEQTAITLRGIFLIGGMISCILGLASFALTHKP